MDNLDHHHHHHPQDHHHRTLPRFFLAVLSGGGKDGQDIQYAICLTKWVALPQQLFLQHTTTTSSSSSSSFLYAPITYCIIAQVPWIRFFQPLLHNLMGLFDLIMMRDER
jgi:hypothetical protein